MEFDKYMQSLDDSELLKAFNDFQESRDTGVLPEGKAREIWRVWDKMYNTHASLTYIETEIFREMARRYYELKSK